MVEWDERKNARNVLKHGISFDYAIRIFEGIVLTAVDDRQSYGEIREISVGAVDGQVVLAVIHTDRNGDRRIISARHASRKERSRYAEAVRRYGPPASGDQG